MKTMILAAATLAAASLMCLPQQIQVQAQTGPSAGSTGAGGTTLPGTSPGTTTVPNATATDPTRGQNINIQGNTNSGAQGTTGTGAGAQTGGQTGIGGQAATPGSK